MSNSKIKLFAFDIDGVLTDGRLYYGANGEEEGLKVFHAQDGLGLSLLRKSGVILVAISGRSTTATKRRLEDLGVHHMFLGTTAKKQTLQSILNDTAINASEAAFMGDDLIDLPAMTMVELAMAPANAVKEVKAAAQFVTNKQGGLGAVREAAEHILALNSISPLDLLDDVIQQ